MKIIKKFVRFFYQEFNNYFEEDIINLTNCQSRIHNELKMLDMLRVDFLSEFEKIDKLLNGKTYLQYLDKLNIDKNCLEDRYDDIDNQIKIIRSQNEKFKQRMKEWRDSYNKLSWHIRLFRKKNKYKNQLLSWSHSFMLEDELDILNRSMSIEEIEKTYRNKINKNDFLKKELNDELTKLNTDINNLINKITNINNCFELLKEKIEKLINFSKININLNEDIIKNFNISQINDLYLDKIRYVEFWLAVHYYECRWLNEKNINNNQKGKTFKKKDVLGIITPFKSQSALIRKKLKAECSDFQSFIDVGTVHAFQGAEKNIIIFSSVYGKNNGCFFIDKNSRLMNVAVSRAKDSFLLFGDERCLNDDIKMASGLLKSMIKTKI